MILLRPPTRLKLQVLRTELLVLNRSEEFLRAAKIKHRKV